MFDAGCFQPPAVVDYLARFLCAGFAVLLLATGCAGSRPLKGGKAVVTRTPSGSVQQTLTQSENPAQATKQEQESLKVRTYTVPAGSRMEQLPASAFRFGNSSNCWYSQVAYNSSIVSITSG